MTPEATASNQLYLAQFRSHRGDPLSFIINALCRGSHSHSAWYDPTTGEIIEAYYPRVRRRPLGEGEAQDIDFSAVPRFTFKQWAGIRDYCQQAIDAHEPYSIPGLFRFCAFPRMFLGNGIEGNGKYATFCSQFVFESAQFGCGHRFLNTYSYTVDPEHLGWSTDFVPVTTIPLFPVRADENRGGPAVDLHGLKGAVAA